ncbi:MAG TPA: glycosyl hydrolase [Solirubrobacteraceae bacterium]
MRRRVAAALVFLLTLATAPAVAHARVLVGIGDQKPAMFGDARFRWLGVRQARIVVSWDVQRSTVEQRWVAAWLDAARAAGVEPLVAFGHAWSGPRRRYLPGTGEFAAAFARFRRAYPWVREYTAWNEANHCSQPTCRRPDKAAAYYDAVKDACPGCTVVAADVLDQPNMASWIRAFTAAARHAPRLWGLHNYLDANRLRTSGTRHLLRVVRGQVWITETGGLVRRNHYRAQIAFPESASHAATVTRFVLQVADRQPRIRRVYLYQWNADSLFQAWDSGLIDPFGHRRPAFDVLARHAGRDPRGAPADPVFTEPAEPPPASEQPPPSQGGPPPQDPQQPPPQNPPPQDPPPPSCTLPPPLCPGLLPG